MDANITLMFREAITAEGQLHSPHYLKTVTELGDGRKVYAIRDIYSPKGVKLLSSGSLVNSSIYQRLLHHKLTPKLDDCLTTEDGVNNHTLVEEANLLIGFDDSLLRMRKDMKDDSLIFDILVKIPLNPRNCSNVVFTIRWSPFISAFNRV